MKYSVWPIEPSYPDQPYLGSVFTSKMYDYTNDLESAIFIGIHLLSDKVYRVHIMDSTNKYKAIILRDGHITSPQVLTRIN